MTIDRQTELTPAETDALLGRHRTCVVSLADGNEPYAAPVSYGYDAEARRFYLRLVSTPESGKRRFLDESVRTRVVVYEEDADTYRSVIAGGTLEEVPRGDLTVEHVQQFGDAKRPLFEMWGESRSDLDVRLYQLDPDDLSGREIAIGRDDG